MLEPLSPPMRARTSSLLSSPDGGRSEQVGARCALSNGRSATTASAPVRVRVPPGVVGDSRSLSASVPGIGLYPQSGAGGLAVVGDSHSRRVNRPGPATWPARSTGPLIRPRRFSTSTGTTAPAHHGCLGSSLPYRNRHFRLHRHRGIHPALARLGSTGVRSRARLTSPDCEGCLRPPRRVEVDTQGDAFFYAFPTGPGAVAAALEAQEAFSSTPIRVRMGVHTGTPHLIQEGYVGEVVHRGARIAADGHGGQATPPSTRHGRGAES